MQKHISLYVALELEILETLMISKKVQDEKIFDPDQKRVFKMNKAGRIKRVVSSK